MMQATKRIGQCMDTSDGRIGKSKSCQMRAKQHGGACIEIVGLFARANDIGRQ